MPSGPGRPVVFRGFSFSGAVGRPVGRVGRTVPWKGSTIQAQVPDNEAQRLAALASYDILDTDPDEAFDELAALAAQVCEVPIAFVSLVDTCRQWFKSKVGLPVCETPRDVAFCSHAILQPDEVLVVEDAREDPRFADNPLVLEAPRIRFYAGAPLITPEGLPLGTLCVIDQRPRQLGADKIDTLRVLSRQVMTQLQLRKNCSDLERLTTELSCSNNELKEFTYIAAHDLQEPTRKLIAFSQLLEMDLGDKLSGAVAKDLGFIMDAARRMHTLIHDLLELSRVGTRKTSRKDVSLRDCLQEAMKALELRLQETDAEVIIDELPTGAGDATLLTLLFQNLLSNALKFVEQGRPRIHVTCGREDNRTIVGVQDNGIGVAAEYAEQIFGPFKRLHSRDSYEGTGIGLSIANKAVARHQGRIWVESKVGEGSHFKFHLPGFFLTPVSTPCAMSEKTI